MDQKNRLLGILSSCMLAASVYGIRAQIFLVIVVPIVGLFASTVRYRSRVSLVGLTTALLLVYPTPQMGWLYGRDSHAAAMGAARIASSGWKPSNVPRVGFLETPALHVLTALGSHVTGLPIYPQLGPRLLLPPLLSIFATALILLTSYVLARRFISDASLLVVCFLSIVTWVHLYRFYTAFRREVIGLLFVLLLIFTLIAWFQKPSNQLIGIVLLLGVTIPIVHHFSSAIGILIISIAAFVDIVRSSLSSPSHSSFNRVLVISSATLLLWWLWLTDVFKWIFFIGIFSFTQGDFSLGRFFYQFGSVSNLTIPVQVGIVKRLPYVFVAILAVSFSIGIFSRWRQNKLQPSYLHLFLFSCAIGVLTVLTYFISFIHTLRVMTFFVIPVGAIALFSLQNYFHERLGTRGYGIIVALVICLAVLGAATVQPHVVSDSQPYYAAGEMNQRFSQPTYGVAAFAADYTASTIVGDANTLEVVVPSAKGQGRTALENLVGDDIPEDSILVLADRNEMLYKGYSGKNAGVTTNLDIHHLISRNNKIYTNGEYKAVLNG